MVGEFTELHHRTVVLLVRPGMLPFGVRTRFVFVRLIFSLKMLTRCRIRGVSEANIERMKDECRF